MDWTTLVLALLIGVIGIAWFVMRKSNKLKELGILCPPTSSLIANSISAITRRIHLVDHMESVYRLNEQADYVGFYDFREPMILIRSPELIKSILIKNFDHFTDHRNFIDPELDPLFSANLFILRGERWQRLRNLLSPAFTSSRMKYMFELMSACGKNFVDCLIETSSSSDSNIVDCKETFTRYTNDVVATCAFGISVDSMKDRNNDFYVMGKEATNFNGIRGLNIMLSRLFPALARLLGASFVSPKVESFFLNVVRETIEKRDKEGITRPDVLQLMMQSRDNKSEGTEKLSIYDMTAQAFGFFFGGFESSATAMCLTANEIAANPQVQEKLRDEIDNVLSKNDGQVSYDSINGMEYLDAVISETLRLYPINFFIERLCVKRFELPPALPGGKPITIDPGQNIWYPTFSIQRNSKYFPNPEKFDPERFLGSAKSQIDPFTYLPFGQGPRMCLGNRFALLEIKVLIFYLLAKCYLKPRPNTRSPIEIDPKSFNLTPKGGYFLEIIPRNSS